MTKILTLTKGKTTLVDDDVFAWASQTRAHVSQVKPGYFAACVMVDCHRQYLHRVILDAPRGVIVDHINGDPLDNRRENLRLATYSTNQQNSRKRAGCSSQFKGVHWVKHDRVWVAQIGVNGNTMRLGRFASEIEAAAAYNVAARAMFGEFARPNLIEGVAQ